MRLSLRFVLPLMLVLAGIAYAVAPLVDQLTLKWFVRDLDIRATLIANTIQEPLQEQLAAGKKAKIGAFFARITQDERLYAVGYCASDQSAARWPAAPCRLKSAAPIFRAGRRLATICCASAQGPLHVAVKPMTSELGPAGKLVLVHDMSFVTRRSEETKRYVFYFFMALAAVVSLITVIIAQLSWRGWMAGMRSLLRGEGLLRQPEAGAQVGSSEFKPIARDLQRLVRELEAETGRATKARSPGRRRRCAPSFTANCAART
jgi:trehalose 6-phosphate synthase